MKIVSQASIALGARTLGVVLCLMLATIAGGYAQAQTYPAPGAVMVAPTDKNLLYMGRWDRSDPANSHGNWIGSYVRVNFTGTSVGINLGGNSGLDVIIDNEPTRVVVGGPGPIPLNPLPLAPGLHMLSVGVKGGGGWDFRGLVLETGGVTKPPVKRPVIEAIGDSITSGSGGPIEAGGNYTVLTAEALGCDHTQISWPGRALTTGYGCQGDKAGLDKQYFLRRCFYDKGPDVPWDFTAYTPQIVEINLGQNDGCGSESNDTFQASYTGFLQNIRAKLPKAQIVALRPFGGGYADAIQKAVATLNAGGDARVHYVDTTGWLDNPADFQDGVHPNDKGQLKAAVRLAPILKPLLAAASYPATVGDPAHPLGLARALQNAYIRGDRPIVVTPGTYFLPRKGATQIALNNWQNAVISAYKVTVILQHPSFDDKLFNWNNCTNVTLEGPTLSQTDQVAYQGHVTAFGKDGAVNTCDWRPSAGYPVPPAGTKELWINVVDAKTRFLKKGVGDFYHAALQPADGGLFRFHLNDSPPQFSVGDWIVARYGEPPNKIFLGECHNCTLKDITLMRNGFAPIFEAGGGGNHLLSCHWALGPRPAGATEDSIVTNHADGFHSAGATLGPDIENCTFDGVFLDDCIAIHGNYQKFVSADGPKVVVENGWGDLRVGDPIRFENDKGFYLQANVLALEDNATHKAPVDGSGGTSTATIDTTATIPADATVSNPMHDGSGYKIIGCRLGNTRSRGIIPKADHGLIRGNVISHCGAGLQLGPEWSQESDYCNHVIVEGNTFSDNGDAIIVQGPGAAQNHDITLRNNHFISNYGRTIELAWVDGVTVDGNTFAGTSVWPLGTKPKPPISVHDSKNVTISNIQVKAPDAYARPYVNVGANVEQLTQPTQE